LLDHDLSIFESTFQISFSTLIFKYSQYLFTVFKQIL